MSSTQGYEHADAFSEGELKVGTIHRIHYWQYGNPNGKPVIFLHGGPGGGTSKANTIFFNPATYHLVLLDQRGCGASTPTAEIRENTTSDLIEDIETLRQHLGITKWHMVFGGSWGSTLALAYAQAYPHMTGSLVIRGVFLGTKEELELGFGKNFTALMCPEEYERMVGYLPEEKRGDPLRAYYELIMQADRSLAYKAGKEWMRYEMSVSTLQLSQDLVDKLDDEKWVMHHATMETHYFINACFLEPGQLLAGCEKIKNTPMRIVQGRYDMLCPPKAAWDIHKAIPGSKIYFSNLGGHAATEPGTKERLIQACDELAGYDFHLQ